MEISPRLKSCVLFFNDIGCEDESATDEEQMEKVRQQHTHLFFFANERLFRGALPGIITATATLSIAAPNPDPQ